MFHLGLNIYHGIIRYVVKGVGQGESHLLTPFTHLTKHLWSAYVPGIGGTLVNKTDKMLDSLRLAGRKRDK